MEKITILITDDHKLVREGWSFVLNADPRFQVIAQTGSAEEAIELARQLRPNIVIMDINLPGINGMDVIPLVRKYSPGSKILGLSLHTQPAYVRKMMRKGAMGYVTKNSSTEELCNAILEIHNNRKYICQEIKNILSEQARNDEKPTGIHSLSQREVGLIVYIKNGHSSKEIADILNLSVKTIEVHRYHILKKLKLKNTAELVDYISHTELAFD